MLKDKKNEDLVIDLEEESTDVEDSGMLDFGLEDSEQETTEETMIPETKSEEADKVAEDTKEETTSEEQEVDLDDLDLTDFFSELETELESSNSALDTIEENAPESSSEISLLRDSLKKMEDKIKELNNANVDLKFKNAELAAFGSDNTDPKLLIVSKNLVKAQEWDEKSKSKVVSTLKDMLYSLTGEDFDNTKINKDIELLTASEMYNSAVNPNIKSKDTEDDYGIMV